MQYSLLRNAYGVSGFENPSAESAKVAPPAAADRDWMSAPPQPMLSATAPLVVPPATPTVDLGYREPVLVPEPPAFTLPHRRVHASAQAYYDPLHADRYCAVCRQRTDRDTKMMIVYIASGMFLLMFMDTAVRLAVHMAKKR